MSVCRPVCVCICVCWVGGVDTDGVYSLTTRGVRMDEIGRVSDGVCWGFDWVLATALLLLGLTLLART